MGNGNVLHSLHFRWKKEAEGIFSLFFLPFFSPEAAVFDDDDDVLLLKSETVGIISSRFQYLDKCVAAHSYV